MGNQSWNVVNGKYLPGRFVVQRSIQNPVAPPVDDPEVDSVRRDVVPADVVLGG